MPMFRSTHAVIGTLSIVVKAESEDDAADADLLFAALDQAGIQYEIERREFEAAAEIEQPAGMTFLQAMQALAARDGDDAKASRPHGPEFTVDHLGQLTAHGDCLYLGDILDLADWQVAGTNAIEDAADEEECREALTEAGWIEADSSLFAPGIRYARPRDGRVSMAATWAALSRELLAEV